MGGKKKNQTSKHPPIMSNQEEYDLKRSFSRLNRYRSSNLDQTKVSEGQDSYNPPIDSSQSKKADYYSLTNPLGTSYYRLEDKISALSDKNDAAHENLRKELEGKIDKVKVDVDKKFQNNSDNWKWIIGIAITVILAVVGYFVYPYQKSNKNQQEIIRIQTTIDESIKPSIEKNTKAIENNSLEIKGNTEKINQIQQRKK